MLFQNGRIRDKGHIFNIIYRQIAQITYGKSSHETYYTHNHPLLLYMLWWKDKTSSRARGMNEMRNAGYYMWEHFNLWTPQI